MPMNMAGIKQRIISLFAIAGLTTLILKWHGVTVSSLCDPAAFDAASFFANAPSSPYHHSVGVLRYVKPKIGTYGTTPNGNGGMIPSVSPPFGMTRWTPQTRENFISQCPYNDMDPRIHGFQATHQPAIWMGESGQVVLNPGVGEVKPLFVDRGHRFSKGNEFSTPYVYEVTMDATAVSGDDNLTESIYSPVPGGAQSVPRVVTEGANGRTRRTTDVDLETFDNSLPRQRSYMELPLREDTMAVAMTASSHVGRIKVDFPDTQSSILGPHIFVQATRQNWTGFINVDPAAREIWGGNPQRQDYALGPSRAPGFGGYFVSRFSEQFSAYGISEGDSLHPDERYKRGREIGAYVRFEPGTREVEVRTGVSFVSVEQARNNLDIEAPDDISFSDAVDRLKQAWLEKLGRITIEGVNQTTSDFDARTIWYTGLFHALQYPSDFSEPMVNTSGGLRTFYSGYTDAVHTAHDSYYQSWSIWDTFRAEHSLLTLFAPERVNSMMRSLVQICQWTGRLPMWANVVETNIMIGTHVDAVIANSLVRGFRDFDVDKAWQGVERNAFIPPINDTEILYYDREPDTPDEARAGLTSYMAGGYVANDGWAESGSRTLDYAFDDFAASVVARDRGDEATAQLLADRSMNYRNIYNRDSGLMEARNGNGSWAGSEQGWCEGDAWVYTFNVMHDPEGLAELMGGRAKMKSKLDEYFQGGHNDHSNEPSHHAPYMYAAIGYPASTQHLAREIAFMNYNATSAGLSGNEDLGQMSAWYIFSALGFYPLNPASDEYVVGSPFFEKVTIRFPAGASTGGVGGQEHTLTITAPGASTKPFVKALKVDGAHIDKPLLLHRQIVTATRIEFTMATTPQSWGSM